QIAVSHAPLTLGGTSQVKLDFGLLGGNDPNSSNAFWHAAHAWRILDWTGTGNPNQLFHAIANPHWSSGAFALGLGSGADQGDVFLNFQPVPEPSTFGLVLLGAMSVGLYRWLRPAGARRHNAAPVL